MSAPITDLRTRGFVALEYPSVLRHAVNKTMRSWQKFYSLPTEIKKSLPYSNGSVGVGYELKEGVGAKADRKENFDVMLSGKKWLQEHADQIESQEALDFIKDATALVEIAKPLILDFASAAERAFDLKGFAQEVDQSEDAFSFRFIHYFGDREIGVETATAHTDQSGFTLHLFESAPGLQCLTFGRQWIDMPVSEGETVIIPAMQMQLRSNNMLKALSHRVVATEETAKTGRYSAVCFVQLKNTPKYNKEKWGRLQEMSPGFNYNLSAGEFKSFFKM